MIFTFTLSIHFATFCMTTRRWSSHSLYRSAKCLKHRNLNLQDLVDGAEAEPCATLACFCVNFRKVTNVVIQLQE